MASLLGKYRLYLLLSLSLVTSRAFAEGDRSSGSSEPTRSATMRASIRLIAEAARSPELRGVLKELLERDNVETHFSERTQFDADDVWQSASVAQAVDVFVVPRRHDAARLYFRAPDGKRFLVRDVALSSGLDALGRELIAQVVESAVVALLHSGVGVSRAELQNVLAARGSDAQRGESPPPAAKGSTPGESPQRALTARPSPPSPRRAATALVGWLATKYALAWPGGGIGAQSGPGLELGVALQRAAFVRVRLGIEQDFPVSAHFGPIDARVSTDRWRAMLDLGTSLGQARAIAWSIGAGQDRSTIEPTASHDRGVLLASSIRSTPAVVHSEVRFEAGVAGFRLALAAGLAIPLLHTPYNVDAGPTAKQLEQPWAVQPSAALSLAWQPRLASF